MIQLLDAVAVRLPPLHAASDRELLARIGPWEVRRHPIDERFTYFARRSMLHLQLWHSANLISVLTPSQLTGGRFEIATSTRRTSVADWTGVIAQLPDQQLPCRAELAALTMWLVVRCEVARLET